ncbi:MAG: hypothetical protein HZA54_20745 [Planctomycetes bacterium]|nr:hypothetical protein [Planctomycetota bacterium]
MQYGKWVGILVLVVGCACGGCDKKSAATFDSLLPSSKTAPPGYSGAVPSPDAQGVAKALRGSSFADAAGTSWTIQSFAVVPNPASGLGPVVHVTRAGGEGWLPTPGDGDIADLYRRVHGSAPASLTGALSAEYQKGLAALK